MGGYYFFVGSNLEKYGKFWKNDHFSGLIWPDWGNTAWADMAGLGSMGLNNHYHHQSPITFLFPTFLKVCHTSIVQKT